MDISTESKRSQFILEAGLFVEVIPRGVIGIIYIVDTEDDDNRHPDEHHNRAGQELDPIQKSA